MGSGFNEETSRELLKQKLEGGRYWISIYVRIFIVYIAITGAILGYALGTDSKQLFLVLDVMGIVTTLFYGSVCFVMHNIRKKIAEDINRLNDFLGNPLNRDELWGMKYISISEFGFASIVLIGWIVLIKIGPLGAG